MFCHMKDMGRYGNIAFCAFVWYYCSIITAEVTSSPPAYERRGDDLMPSSLSRDQTQLFSNHTSLNSTGSKSDPDTAAGTMPNSPAPAENITSSENITDHLNGSEASPVNNETRVTMATLTTLQPSVAHEPESEILTTTFHPTAAGITTGPEPTTPPTRRKSSPAATAVSAQTTTVSSRAQANARVETPSALNVGDNEDIDVYPKVSSDPLLAGLVSAFVIVSALGSVLIFLKFRNRNNGPEFSRLQDLPMDNMLEDAPLSMYSY